MRLGGLPGPVCGRRTATRGGPYAAMVETVSAVAGRCWRLGRGRPLLAPTIMERGCDSSMLLFGRRSALGRCTRPLCLAQVG